MLKRTLSVEELEAQTALELPNREMLLIFVTLTRFLNNNEVAVQVPIGVAANVCGVDVGVLAGILDAGNTYECTAESGHYVEISQ